MSLLGFDTSTSATSACVLRSDGEAFEILPSPERLLERPGHAAELMPAVAEVMERAGVGFNELEGIAVGVGPGTFTGLRIGIATARALAATAGLTVRPVSSPAALAAGIEEPLALALIDARRGEVFAALYDDGTERWAPFAASPTDVAERVRAAGISPLAAGDGSVRFREELEASGVRVAPPHSRSHAVSALQVCRLATGVAGVSPEAVFPNYLRPPDAKPR